MYLGLLAANIVLSIFGFALAIYPEISYGDNTSAAIKEAQKI
jgi:hypothetical protein